jgi:hypothetical protein
MTVLTQDTARLFLGNSSPANKYQLFMKGVQLLQLDVDYNMIEGTASTMQQTLGSKAEALDELKVNDRQWRSQMQLFERSAEIEEEVRKLQNMYAWVQVKVAEQVKSPPPPPTHAHTIGRGLTYGRSLQITRKLSRPQRLIFNRQRPNLKSSQENFMNKMSKSKKPMIKRMSLKLKQSISKMNSKRPRKPTDESLKA